MCKMGEQSRQLKDHGNSNAEQEHDDNDDESMLDDEMGDDIEPITPEEIAKLDSQLDEMNSALDDIEQKNDDIHAKLLELLNANREIRQQLQNSASAPTEDENTSK